VVKFLAASVCSVSLILAVGGCQTTDTTSGDNIGGGTVEYSKWQTVQPRKLSINIDRLIEEPIDSLKRRHMNNRTEQLHIRFGNSRGVIFTQYAIGSWFGQSSRDHVRSKSTFENWARKRLKNKISNIENIIRLGDYSNTRPDGFKAIANLTDGTKCVISIWGARIGELTAYDNDEGLYDIGIWAHYCASTVDVTYFDTMISDLDVK
jgi:hypothetical protein